MSRIFLLAARGFLAKGRKMRRTQIELLSPSVGRVLFIGDSITEQGMWSEWFPEFDTLNRGIASDTVGGVRSRLAYAIYDPAVIVLLIGTNDLSGLGRSTSVRDISGQMRDLVSGIRELAPTQRLIINSVMPRQRSYAKRVQRLNMEYRKIAAEFAADYLDLWPTLANSGGVLRPEYTEDNLHLNGSGYRAWVDVLRPAIFADQWNEKGKK